MRRRPVSAERAWFYKVDSLALEVALDMVTVTQQLITFPEIQTDFSAVGRETSEFYIERMLLWITGSWLPNSATRVTHAPVLFTVGTIDTDELVDNEVYWSADTIDRFGRIFQQDIVNFAQYNTITYDGAAVAVNSAPTADFQGIPIIPPVHKYDMAAKFRIREDQPLSLSMSAASPFVGDTLDATFWFKALLRRGK